MKDDLGHNIGGDDWIRQDAAELFRDIQRINNCHLYRKEGRHT